MREWIKIFHANRNNEKAGVAILRSHKIDFKTKSITKDKEGHYILIKGSIQKEDIIPININLPKTPKYIKQTLIDIKRVTDNSTVTVGDFNTPLTSMNRSSRQKISKAAVVLNDTIDQLDLIDIYQTFHAKTAEYTFFSNADGTFSKTDHMLVQKTSLKSLKRLKIELSYDPAIPLPGIYTK